jgi:2-keto-3-deoxy-L-rhamnonate aldolase RhmA
MRTNVAKRKLAAGEPVICAGGIEDPDLVEQFGAAGLTDVAWLELEHGRWTWADLAPFSRACDLWGITSQVRVQRNDPAEIMRALDQGIQAVIVPHVKTVADAERAVSGAFYAPLGLRGMGLSRQSYGVDDYFAHANDDVMLGLILEDVEAIERLEDIVRVPHVDYFFVAPFDLSQSMGPAYAGKPDHPDVQRVVADAIAAIASAGRAPGALVSEDNVAEQLELGARFLLYSPLPYLFEGARRFRDRVR